MVPLAVPGVVDAEVDHEVDPFSPCVSLLELCELFCEVVLEEDLDCVLLELVLLEEDPELG
jgi:hypothetical protein